ncbi:MAG TPA: DUF664 domain-containing protein [Streptosporangiaceae bacterium]|nr:DUF664 domain-containing protein [Streptosporangiaceae bacterium]
MRIGRRPAIMCLAAQARSAISLTGLVQHLAEVERNWSRRVLAGEQVPPVYDPHADPDGPDGGFDLAERATLSGAWWSGARRSPAPASSAPPAPWPAPAGSWTRT